MTGRVLSVALSARHTFSKIPQSRIELVKDRGVRGDAHYGAIVQHRSRIARHPDAPNLRQVHLIHAEMLDRIRALGHRIEPGDIGENILTEGIDLLALGAGTRLTIGAATLVVTGLRNPCHQLDKFAPGLRRAFMPKRTDGGVDRLAGVMAVVAASGRVAPGDVIDIAAPSSHTPLDVV